MGGTKSHGLTFGQSQRKVEVLTFILDSPLELLTKVALESLADLVDLDERRVADVVQDVGHDAYWLLSKYISIVIFKDIPILNEEPRNS